MTFDVVTIDGPSGSGKGTAAYRLASTLGFHLLDSGAIYRLAALKSIKDSVNLNDETAVLECIKSINISFELGEELAIPLLDSVDVSKEIRTEKTGDAASIIAQYPDVRAELLQCQRVIFCKLRDWSRMAVIWVRLFLLKPGLSFFCLHRSK